MVLHLATRPIPCVVPEGVFDDFGWCESSSLEWRRPARRPFDRDTPIDGSDPARMVFVFRGPCDFLPQELASLHAFGMGLGDELALAPYAIDDATDELWSRKVEPRSLLWLAADNLNALFWGLHDWAHFHSHGPFDQPAWTEVQCDAAALTWIKDNAAAIGIEDLDALEDAVVALTRRRFEAEGIVGAPFAEIEEAIRSPRSRSHGVR